MKEGVKKTSKQYLINRKHQKIGKKKLFDAGKTRCENCKSDWWLTIAHRNRRIFYLKWPEGLSDFNQIITLCQPCHYRLDGKPKELEELFKRLRK